MPGVYIVDDHKLFASGLAGLLQDDLPGHDISVFADVEAALAADGAPDLILLDFYLPGLSGAKAIATCRSAAPGAQVIVISASLSPADKQASEAAGAAAFLSKAADPDEVVAAIAAILRGERAAAVAPDAPAAAVRREAKAEG